MNFKNWSLKSKLIAMCLFLSTFSVITGGIGYYALQNVTQKYDEVANSNFPASLALADMRGASRRARIYALSIAAQESFNQGSLKSAEEIKKSIASYDKAKAITVEQMTSEDDKATLKESEEDWAPMAATFDKVIALVETRTPDSLQILRKIVLKDLQEQGLKYSQSIDKAVAQQREEAKNLVDQATKATKFSTLLIFLSVTVGFAFALLLGMFFSGALSRQLRSLAEDLNQGTEDVASAAQEVSDAGTELSAGATQQAAALQETVASLDEISAMVNKNADNSKRSTELTASSLKAANQGQEVVEEMIRSIGEVAVSNKEIMGQIETSNQEISEIVKMIVDIGNKTKVINDIVFQTKLLSFNASVEAARAGEHGKGFAVVAEEVGNLAQMSGNAAKEISAMLESSIQKVEGIVSQTKTRVDVLVARGKEKLDASSTTASRCGNVLAELVTQVESVSQMSSEISTACNEQAQGIQEITKAMAQLDQVTQQNATASQQSAGAAEQLTLQSKTLHGIVVSLMSSVNGANAGDGVKAQGPRSGATPAVPQKTSASAENIIPFKKKAQLKKPVPAQKLSQVMPAARSAKAVGGSSNAGANPELSIPSENDPRFEDV
jgi:methyl-accepting chemotaxis protein